MNLKIFNTIIIILMILKINPIKAYGQKFTTNQNNVYYIDSEQKYSWFEALIACIEMDMTLVTIDSSTKSYEINNLVKNNFGKILLWIGGIMTRYPNRHFIWLATGKPFTYTYWQGNNPDFYGNTEYCAHIGWGADLQWNDIACTNHQGFICEYSQQRQENKKIQKELQNEKLQQQELQQQLLQKVQNQQDLQSKMQEKQLQHEKLQQELKNIQEVSERENRTNQELQQELRLEITERADKLKESEMKYEKLKENLVDATTKLQKLQQELLIQQNLKDLLKEEFQKLKEKDQEVSSSGMNKKYRDIILHFHQSK